MYSILPVILESNRLECMFEAKYLYCSKKYTHIGRNKMKRNCVFGTWCSHVRDHVENEEQSNGSR